MASKYLTGEAKSAKERLAHLADHNYPMQILPAGSPQPKHDDEKNPPLKTDTEKETRKWPKLRILTPTPNALLHHKQKQTRNKTEGRTENTQNPDRNGYLPL